jgi:hypothetical protein
LEGVARSVGVEIAEKGFSSKTSSTSRAPNSLLKQARERGLPTPITPSMAM